MGIMDICKFNIPEDLKRRLHAKLVLNGITLTDFFCQCAQDYVDRVEPKAKKEDAPKKRVYIPKGAKA